MPQIHRIKTELAVLGAVTEVGFRAEDADVQAIHSLAAELEALNPSPQAAHMIGLLRGRWRLIYSNFELQRATTLSQLSLGICAPEPVEVVELYNEIDPSTGLYDNVIYYLDAEGMAGTMVLAGQFQPVDDRRISLQYNEVLLTGPLGAQSFPADGTRVEELYNDITYLDDGFRLVRGAYGSLYILERLDPSPLIWSRDN